MKADRYLKAILTVIAIELGWIGFQGSTPAVSAQTAATPVVIRGIELAHGAFLPVGIAGSYRSSPDEWRSTLEPMAVRIDTTQPIKIEADQPLKIEADRPLLIQAVPYTATPKPGE